MRNHIHTQNSRRQVDKLFQTSCKTRERSIHLKNWLSHLSYTFMVVFCLPGITATAVATPGDSELKIGIWQRFGEKTTDQLTLKATPGDRLKLRFVNGNQPLTLSTGSDVKLAIVMQPLSAPLVQEQVVLSTHSSFESAEDSAIQWRSQGIEVEIAQPNHWQVWAKREVYKTPLLRRLLLQSLQTAGNKTAYINTQIWQRLPRASWVVNGTRYSPMQVDITADKNLIEVKGKDDRIARPYYGSLRLQPNAYSTYTLVNNVPLETYLRGVVPSEIEADSSNAALEAQAILARTYVLRNLRRFGVDDYELCADTQCQVYLGLSGTTASTDQAIAATRGQVLTYHNQLVDALYSSTTGGVTAAFSDIWNGPDRPYLQPVVDAAGKVWSLQGQSLASEKNLRQFIALNQGFNEAGRNGFRWRRESSMEQIAKDLQHYFQVTKSPLANFKTVQQMGVVARSSTGRVLKLAVKTDRGVFALEKDEVRDAFSAPTSTLFYLDALNKGQKTLWGYAFVGGGLGHGVGLSQTGCQELAKLGWSSSRILNFYYPGTQTQLLSKSIF